ncbi:hypothetical protein JD969_14980 [Planctomycetota bacterium]|nr:hypothetical protein JD969_14980 [Planctomycetota bacterium]
MRKRTLGKTVLAASAMAMPLYLTDSAEAVSTHLIADFGNSGYVVPSNDIGGDSPGPTQSALSAGYSFTVDEAGLYFTDLAKLSGETGATETVALYNLTTGEIVASVTDIADTHREYEFYEFDAPIEAQEGHEYAVIGHYSAESDVARWNAEISHLTDYVNQTSPLTYTGTLALADEDANPIDNEFLTPGQGAYLEFFYDNFGNSFTQGLEPVPYGAVDVGFATAEALAEAGILVPTPSAAAAGMISLGLLILRRRSNA